jgi:hypothetical protein
MGLACSLCACSTCNPAPGARSWLPSTLPSTRASLRESSCSSKNRCVCGRASSSWLVAPLPPLYCAWARAWMTSDLRTKALNRALAMPKATTHVQTLPLGPHLCENWHARQAYWHAKQACSDHGCAKQAYWTMGETGMQSKPTRTMGVQSVSTQAAHGMTKAPQLAPGRCPTNRIGPHVCKACPLRPRMCKATPPGCHGKQPKPPIVETSKLDAQMLNCVCWNVWRVLGLWAGFLGGSCRKSRMPNEREWFSADSWKL